MYINENGKYTENAEYFFNEYLDLYCVIGTTFAAADLGDLINLFESADLLTEVAMPDYITADYESSEW